MTHAWTFAGRLRVQCQVGYTTNLHLLANVFIMQGSDVWDMDFMQRFLDEIVRLVRTFPTGPLLVSSRM